MCLMPASKRVFISGGTTKLSRQTSVVPLSIDAASGVTRVGVTRCGNYFFPKKLTTFLVPDLKR